jgi:hypothetical protein
MAFLDFIRNRDAQQPAGEQQSKQQTPDVSQDISTKASQEQTVAKPTEYVRADQQARLAEAQALYSKGIQELPPATPPPTPAPDGGATNPQPMRQPMMGQETVAPDMSPTNAQASARAEDVERPSAPAPTPDKSQQQTVARPAPSWER